MAEKILFDPYPRVLAELFDDATKARLTAAGEVVWHDGVAPAPADWIDAHLPDTTILVGQSALPKERLDRAPRLRAVFNVESNFLPNVDYAECHRRGIHVAATGPVFARPVAEMALGLALSAARRLHEADAAIRRGDETLYGTGDNHDSILLSGRPMALIGMGNLGRSLLPLLRPFGGEILAHDPWIHDAVLREQGVVPVSLEEAFRRATVVFILAAHTTENEGRIGGRQFRAMRRGGIVVLASRAGVVQFDELLDAAEAGHLRVAIDVWPEEPIPADHRARRSRNTILQAHRAGNIPEVWPEMGRMVADDIELLARGLPPQRCQRAVTATVAKIRSKPVG